MKYPPPRDDQDRFKAALRHYHRTSQPARRSWDEWISGKPAKTIAYRRWLKRLGILIGILMLVAIIVGLIIELR